MEPPASPRCDKLGPTSGIGLGNVFGAERFLRHPAGISATFFAFCTRPRRQVSPVVTPPQQSAPWTMKSEGGFSIILLTFRMDVCVYNTGKSGNFKCCVITTQRGKFPSEFSDLSGLKGAAAPAVASVFNMFERQELSACAQMAAIIWTRRSHREKRR